MRAPAAARRRDYVPHIVSVCVHVFVTDHLGEIQILVEITDSNKGLGDLKPDDI